MDKIQHNENLTSVKGFMDSYAGKTLFRSTIYPILRLTTYVIVSCKRPNYFAGFSEAQISGVSPEIAGLKVEKEWFSVRFNYKPDENVDSFVDILSSFWNSYEQPSVVFLLDKKDAEAGASLILGASWETITKSIDSIVIYKSIEDDVMWIGKSSTFNFDDFLFD